MLGKSSSTRTDLAYAFSQLLCEQVYSVLIANNDSSFERLKKELSSILILGLGGLIAICIVLTFAWQQANAFQWIIQAGLIWAFIAYRSIKYLNLNRANSRSHLYSNLGWGNRLTLFRAMLIAATSGFLFQSWPEGTVLSWAPGIIYFIAATLDRVDGYVARKTNQSSMFGTRLDTICDALGLAIASLLAVGCGQTHWSFLFMGLAYYGFHSGIYWRNKQKLTVFPLPPAMHRRTWAGFQMGYLVVALWPIFSPPVTLIGGFAFMLPALTGFIIDWLIVSGYINREAVHIDRYFRRVAAFSQIFFQPALRVTIILILVASTLTTGFPPILKTETPWLSSLIIGIFAITSIAILFGIAGRFFALMLIALLSWYYINNPMQILDYWLFCCVVWSLLLGSGHFSLWLKDDHWLNRYDGT